MATIIGSEGLLSPSERRTQVFEATHNGAGSRLPLRDRSFISFSYGGKLIEDFGFIATIDGDRLQRNIYSDFEDNITDSGVWDGQIYWSTHYKANSISFELATDGVEEMQLAAFKRWFKPGEIKELILMEHPNRAIMARISETPVYSIIPFEHQVTTKIANVEYETSITLYKGEISLTFVMDDPFWYSKSQALQKVGNEWSSLDGELYEAKDAIKILLEDNIPDAQMLSRVSQPILIGTESALCTDLSYDPDGSRVNYAKVAIGRVATLINDTSGGVDIGESTIYDDDIVPDVVVEPGYFYYAGTAPCRPEIVFYITPDNTKNNGYISNIANSFTPNNQRKPYNTVVIESTNKSSFRFTTPGIYTGYNQAMSLFWNTGFVNAAWEELRLAIREGVKHWAPRAYAIKIINNITQGGSTKITASDLSTCRTNMMRFITSPANTRDEVKFSINFATGEAYAEVFYNTVNGEYVKSIENVWDMVQSGALTITDRNYPDSEGFIALRTDANPQYTHRIYADIALNNTILKYKHLYL